MKRNCLLSILTAIAGACAAREALAVVWNGTDHPERGVTSSTGLTDNSGSFSNVAVINNAFNSTRGTATYLGNGWIITARHVVQGTSYSNLAPSGSLSFNGIAGALTIAVPDSAEIALVKLQTAPALGALPSGSIYTGSAEGNTLAQLGGFGYWGFIDGTANTSAVFHRAYNIAFISGSFVNIKLDGESRLSSLGLLEGGGMPGDSGSPLFILDAPDTSVNDWTQYKLAGILATSQGGGWQSVSSYARVRNYGALVKDIAFGSGKTFNWARGVAGAFSWNNSTLNGDVTNGNNWNSSLSPTFPNGAGDFANVGSGMGANNQTINLDQNITVGELTIGSTNNGTGIQTVGAGGAFSLTFDNLSAPGMIVHNPGGRADVIAAPVIIAGSGSFLIANPSSSAITISGPITSGKTSGVQTVSHTSGSAVISGAISDGSTGGTVAIDVAGGTLLLSGSNSYTGGTTLDDGTLSLGHAGALGGSGAITFAGGTLQFSNANQIDYSSRFSADANQTYNIDTNGQSVTFATGLTSSGGSLTKLGLGKLTLVGVNTYSGDTNVQNGAVSVAIISATARFNLGAGSNTGALVYTGNGQTTSAVINLGAGLGTGGGIIEQAGAGLLKFTGTNTATGGQKHTLTLQGSTAGMGEIAGAIVDNNATNNTSLVKSGSGTWILSGASTYTGMTSVNGGVLQLASTGALASTSVTVAAGATMSVGGLLASNAVLTVNGALSFAGNAGASSQQRTLAAANVGAGARITLAPPASPAAPLVLSSGTFSFAETTGAIDIANNALIDDYASSNPIADIRTAIARGYNGGAWNGNGITSSHAAAIAADPSSLHKTAIGFADASTLSVSSFAGQTVDQSSVLVRYTFAADANLDGAVNSADFDALAGHFNSAAPLWSSGDFNFDGTVNALDFNFLATNFGSALSSVPLGTVVPEPSAALIASAAILLVRSRQRNCRPRKWRDR